MKSSGSSHIFHVIVSTLMLIASSGVVAAGSNDHVETPTQKQKVVQILEALETVDLGPLQYIDPNHYTNHNARVPDGLAGYKVKLMVVPKGAIKVHLVRVFEDGDFVFTHGEFNFSGHPKAIFDIFRFENEKVVEHWDNVQDEVAASGTSTPTMLDGPAMASDLKATKKNKALITRYLTDVIAGRHDTLPDYFISDGYVEHSASRAKGSHSVASNPQSVATQRPDEVYSKLERVLGQGNFVLALSAGQLESAPTAYYDLYWVKNGKIAEHWSVHETIPSAADSQNSNGKF